MHYLQFLLCSIGPKSDICFYTEWPKNGTFNNFLKNGGRTPKFWNLLPILMCSKSKHFLLTNKKIYFFDMAKKCIFMYCPFCRILTLVYFLLSLGFIQIMLWLWMLKTKSWFLYSPINLVHYEFRKMNLIIQLINKFLCKKLLFFV